MGGGDRQRACAQRRPCRGRPQRQVLGTVRGQGLHPRFVQQLVAAANLEVGLHNALRSEAITEELAVRSDDFKEGMRAFAAKRPPNYTGG